MFEIKNNDYKEKILEFISEGEKSTSDIASYLSRNYYDVMKMMEQLEEEDCVIRIEVSKFTFWKKRGIS